jgi:hypothetical protein
MSERTISNDEKRGVGMSRGRAVLIGGGALVMGYAVAGAVTAGGVHLGGVALFLLAMLVLHDGVFLPAVLGVGALAGRFVPGRWRATVRAAGVISLAVAVVGAPLALGFGRSADNPSVLPRAYGWGMTLILVVVWGVSAGIRKGLARRRGADYG